MTLRETPFFNMIKKYRKDNFMSYFEYVLMDGKGRFLVKIKKKKKEYLLQNNYRLWLKSNILFIKITAANFLFSPWISKIYWKATIWLRFQSDILVYSIELFIKKQE
jgi:hypothetical protein